MKPRAPQAWKSLDTVGAVEGKSGEKKEVAPSLKNEMWGDGMSIFKDLGRWYWSWLGFLTGPALGAIAIYLWLRGIAVRDWVFLLLIVVLALGEVFIFSYIRHNEKKTENAGKKLDALKPTDELLFILKTLAARSGEESLRGLRNFYLQSFAGRDVDEFTAVIGILSHYELLWYIEDTVAITEEGSKYYLTHKERPKKAKK